MDQKKTTVRNALEQNTTNMIFYEDSFTKTSFFTREVSNCKVPVFYIDYDLQFSKAFIEPMSSVMNAVGWQTEKVSTLEDFFG